MLVNRILTANGSATLQAAFKCMCTAYRECIGRGPSFLLSFCFALTFPPPHTYQSTLHADGRGEWSQIKRQQKSVGASSNILFNIAAGTLKMYTIKVEVMQIEY
jgi:hypothetical protein